MKVLVTGAKGQLGTDLVLFMEELGWDVHSFGRETLDVTDADLVSRTFDRIRPDVVFHTAAYTQVDQAEVEEDRAFLVNAQGTKHVAQAAEAVNAKLCYISTDYVFDGRAAAPYREEDEPNPISVYGQSKLAGERYAQEISSRYFIVRTAWVYGCHGRSFVSTMLQLAKTHQEVRVVDDQIGSPTFTEDLVRFLIQLVQTDQYGIYHATNSGSCSWYEFAKAIFEEAGIQIQVTPIRTEELPRKAQRPQYSVLDHGAIRRNGFEDLRHWRDALQDYMGKRR